MKKEIKIQLKLGSTLSLTEIEEMSKMIREYDPGLPEFHLYKSHILKHNPLFIIAYVNDEIVSFQSHKVYKTKNPFFKGNTPVILGGTAYQKQGVSKLGLASKMFLMFVKENFGKFWYLKRMIFIADTINPRSLNSIDRIFKGAYPNTDTNIPIGVAKFARGIMKKYYGEQVEVTDALIMNYAHEYENLTDITDYWDKMYRTNEEKFHNYYLKYGVITQYNGQYFIGGKSVVTVCYYSLYKILKHTFLNRFKTKKNRLAKREKQPAFSQAG